MVGIYKVGLLWLAIFRKVWVPGVARVGFGGSKRWRELQQGVRSPLGGWESGEPSLRSRGRQAPARSGLELGARLQNGGRGRNGRGLGGHLPNWAALAAALAAAAAGVPAPGEMKSRGQGAVPDTPLHIAFPVPYSGKIPCREVSPPLEDSPHAVSFDCRQRGKHRQPAWRPGLL